MLLDTIGEWNREELLIGPRGGTMVRALRTWGADGEMNDGITALPPKFPGLAPGDLLASPSAATHRDIDILDGISGELPRVKPKAGSRGVPWDAAAARLAELEARLAEALAEIDGRRAHLAEVIQERDDLAAAMEERSGAQEPAEIASLREALAVAERDAGADAAAAEAMRTEIARLREALALAERGARESAATEYNLRGDVLRLRKLVVQHERRAREQQTDATSARAVDSLRSELAAVKQQLGEVRDRATQTGTVEAANTELREALRQAEEKLRRHVAEAETARSDIASLRGELDVARDVSTRLVAALRANLVPAPEPIAERVGWWRAALGVLGFR